LQGFVTAQQAAAITNTWGYAPMQRFGNFGAKVPEIRGGGLIPELRGGGVVRQVNGPAEAGSGVGGGPDQSADLLGQLDDDPHHPCEGGPYRSIGLGSMYGKRESV
jgi:hypothetical protein